MIGLDFADIQTRLSSSIIGAIIAIITSITQLEKWQEIGYFIEIQVNY